MRTSFASSSERQVGDCLTPKNGSAEKKAICPHLFHCSAPLIAALPHCPLLRQLVKRISKQGSSLSATSHFLPERNWPDSASSNPPTRAILSSELAQSQWLEWRPHAEGGYTLGDQSGARPRREAWRRHLESKCCLQESCSVFWAKGGWRLLSVGLTLVGGLG